ncbi:MAG: ACT domain-containing protein [Eggerthellaceae bacterium]|nr:ACT domain-containing protein [Eggerthellaceae bacterium]
MKVTQISVFVQSKPGHLARIIKVFSDNGINIFGFSAADTGEYGIVRFIVNRPDEALEALKAAGHAAQCSEILVVALNNVPGELERVLTICADCNINVVYSYSLVCTFIALAVKDIDEAEKALEDADIKLVDIEEIASCLGDTVM